MRLGRIHHENRSSIDEALFSVALKAYGHQRRAKGVMDDRDEPPTQGASSQEGNAVVLRTARRELARYRVLERGGGLASRG